MARAEKQKLSNDERCKRYRQNNAERYRKQDNNKKKFKTNRIEIREKWTVQKTFNRRTGSKTDSKSKSEA